MLIILWSLAAIGLVVEGTATLAGQGNWFQTAAVPLYAAQSLAPIVLYGRKILVGLSKASLGFLFGSIAIYAGGTFLYLQPEVPWNHVLWHAAIVLGCLLNFGGVRELVLEHHALKSLTI